MSLLKIKRALISVSDKTGIVDFAQELSKFNVEIISTGGTAKTLREAGLQVTDVSEVTGFPEMMDGRVKTLHPKIHGAFLALRENEEHQKAMQTHDIQPIDLVVVNLYPFEQTIAKEGVTLAEAIENIDIGGPAMIRSASKNYQDVLVVTNSELYDKVIEELNKNNGSVSFSLRQTFATLAYLTTSTYDAAISDYLTERLSDKEFELVEKYHPDADNPFYQMFKTMELEEIDEENLNFDEDDFDDDELEDFSQNGHPTEEEELFPAYDYVDFDKVSDLRYGENPHQKAALYLNDDGEFGGIANAELLHGKEMSFNNYVDANAAWDLVNEFSDRVCAIIKHTNPSGVGVGETNLEAYKRALATDTVSAFGGIVAFNKTVDAEAAKAVSEIFTEVIVAPEFDEDALEILKQKKNLRILVADNLIERGLEYKQISGGFLVQEFDEYKLSESDLTVVTKRKPSEEEIRAMLFAWKVCKHVKSNAIVLTNEFQTVGVGAGQMNRVDSVRIAGTRAERSGLEIKGTVLASDAFFPFRDGIDECAKLGISAIIQPGGSVRDDETIQAADEHNLAMVFTKIRHFKH
jgi:phosphoribosylaminoimidazolecarboxamide formyltransferase/IMP cyclohydrolase